MSEPVPAPRDLCLPAAVGLLGRQVLQLVTDIVTGCGSASCQLPLCAPQVVDSFDGAGAGRLAGGDPTLQRHLAAAARLEAAAVEQAYGDVRAAESHLAAAEAALGLSMELTGDACEECTCACLINHFTDVR
jgi:hypothetical protein